MIRTEKVEVSDTTMMTEAGRAGKQNFFKSK
jgi:hypothetical protein